MTAPIRIGFALTGSFCTFARVMDVIQTLVRQGCEVTPILSFHAAQLDTRFGDAAMWRGKLFALTGRQPIDTIQAAEPIGPKGLFDVLVVAPCTGNTLAKLAHSVTDTPVVMAVKSHLRGDKPGCARGIHPTTGFPAAQPISARCSTAAIITLSPSARMRPTPSPARLWRTWSVFRIPSRLRCRGANSSL